MRSNKDHRVLAIKEFQDKDCEDVLKRPALCHKQGHRKEELKFFCKNCESAVCQICLSLEHGGHTLSLIEEEAERQKIQMKSIVETQRNNLKAKKNIIRQLDEDYAELIQQGKDVKRDVQKIVDNLISIIEAKKQSIFSSVENKTSKFVESLTKRKSNIEEQIAVIESSLEKAEKLLTGSTNAEVLQLKKSLEIIFGGIHQTKPFDGDPEGLLVHLNFVENEKLLATVNGEEIGSLEILHQTKASQCIAEGSIAGGEAQFILTTRNAQGRHCYHNHDHVTLEIRDEQGQECATEIRINDNKDGSYKIISYSPKEPGRYKVTVKVNGGHVLGSPFTVKVQPFQVRLVLSFGSEGSSVGMFDFPWGVAVNARDEIAVTDSGNHRVQIFSSDGNYLRSFGRKGTKQGEFNDPRGIAFHKNGNILVVDYGNARIQIFSGEGEYIFSFGVAGRLDSQRSDPYGLSVDSDGNMIVADAGNELIKIFSPDGKFLMKIGGQGSFSFPFHCVQCDRYLIVSDCHEHCMKVYDRNGNFQYKFGKQGGGDGEFNNPRFLSVNKSGLLMVCDSGNKRIQVFKLNGKFVGKFGTNGSYIEELPSPWSVAVLSNDRIVVSDFGNDYIKMFELDAALSKL